MLTVVKDLANLSPSSLSSSSPLHRRHSISVCEKSVPRVATSASSSSSSSKSSPSGSKKGSPKQSIVVNNHDMQELNVAGINDTGNGHVDDGEGDGTGTMVADSRGKEDVMQTLSLRLDEVSHIRAVLTKAELEGLPIDGNVRADVERGKASR